MPRLGPHLSMRKQKPEVGSNNNSSKGSANPPTPQPTLVCAWQCMASFSTQDTSEKEACLGTIPDEAAEAKGLWELGQTEIAHSWEVGEADGVQIQVGIPLVAKHRAFILPAGLPLGVVVEQTASFSHIPR